MIAAKKVTEKKSAAESPSLTLNKLIAEYNSKSANRAALEESMKEIVGKMLPLADQLRAAGEKVGLPAEIKLPRVKLTAEEKAAKKASRREARRNKKIAIAQHLAKNPTASVDELMAQFTAPRGLVERLIAAAQAKAKKTVSATPAIEKKVDAKKVQESVAAAAPAPIAEPVTK